MHIITPQFSPFVVDKIVKSRGLQRDVSQSVSRHSLRNRDRNFPNSHVFFRQIHFPAALNFRKISTMCCRMTHISPLSNGKIMMQNMLPNAVAAGNSLDKIAELSSEFWLFIKFELDFVSYNDSGLYPKQLLAEHTWDDNETAQCCWFDYCHLHK